MQNRFRFRLPSFLPGYAAAIRRQLNAVGWMVKTAQVLTSAVLPILEAILINTYSSASGDAKGALAVSIKVIAFIHLVLFLISLGGQTPLPHFLLEFDNLEEKVRDLEQSLVGQEGTSATFQRASRAVEYSLVAIEEMECTPLADVEVVVGNVMKPWVFDRGPIFWFFETAPLHSFAVYLHDTDGMLRLRWRDCNRRIRRTDRPWPVGTGMVGSCFARDEVLFAKDAADTTVNNLLASGKPEDNKLYRSMIAAPIPVHGTKRGVLIVTSSAPDQFSEEFHPSLVKVVAKLIGQALEHCWEDLSCPSPSKQCAGRRPKG